MISLKKILNFERIKKLINYACNSSSGDSPYSFRLPSNSANASSSIGVNGVDGVDGPLNGLFNLRPFELLLFTHRRIMVKRSKLHLDDEPGVPRVPIDTAATTA
ncbi:unnamed protein product [Rhizophagus irregularis]|nr:unnamed protein product [Rhizophagus irregularis]CAB4438331.1 unnamed protein product [Rhizophagus irregularis]